MDKMISSDNAAVNETSRLNKESERKLTIVFFEDKDEQ